MILRILSSKAEIDTLNENDEIVHLSFRPSGKDILKLVARCPKLKAIQVPRSYMDKISRSTQMYLSNEGISLLEGDLWGHRKGVSKSSEPSDNSFYRVLELTELEGLS